MGRRSENKNKADLAACLRSRDAASFRLLYDASHKFLFFYAYKIVSNYHLAEDALQEAFSIIWLEAASYNSELGSPLNWMCTIVKNKSIDLIRKNGALRVEEYFDGESYALGICNALDPYEILRKKQTAIVVKSYLKDLNVAQMEALHLAYYTEMSHNELAIMLRQPLGTVKNHIRRGLLQLKRRETKLRCEV